MGMTNRGKWLRNQWVFRGVALPTNFYIALATNAAVPTADTKLFSELTEIAAGNGYTTGGVSLTKNTTDFDENVENDTNNRSELRIKNILFTASGGPIPASGSGARWVLLTTDEGTIANRQVVAYWNLINDQAVLDGQILPLIDLELRSEEPA